MFFDGGVDFGHEADGFTQGQEGADFEVAGGDVAPVMNVALGFPLGVAVVDDDEEVGAGVFGCLWHSVALDNKPFSTCDNITTNARPLVESGQCDVRSDRRGVP